MPSLFVYEKDLFDPTPDIPSLEGKVIFVTGGKSGSPTSKSPSPSPSFFPDNDYTVSLFPPKALYPTPIISIPDFFQSQVESEARTAGLGKSTIQTLLAHNPSHIYFSGRSLASAEALIASVSQRQPSTSPTNLDSPSPSSTTSSSTLPPPPLTFIQMDLTSLPSITTALAKSFTHARLDILINNAGIMAGGPGLSADGFEIQFATNHLGHAMLVRALLPVLQRTAAADGQHDVRIVNLTSVGYRGHPSNGISFATLRTEQRGLPVLGQWIRYGQSKLANILFTKELARRYPAITSVAVHPGVVDTGLVTNQGCLNRLFVYAPQKIMGATVLTPEQGCWNQVWAAAAARREDLVNGAFYMPVGHLANDELDSCATDEKLAGELWAWTEKVLDEFD